MDDVRREINVLDDFKFKHIQEQLFLLKLGEKRLISVVQYNLMGCIPGVFFFSHVFQTAGIIDLLIFLGGSNNANVWSF